GVSLVLCGPLPQQRPAPAARPARDAPLWHARLRRAAPPLHALLPDVQAQDEAPVVAPAPAGPLPALSLADRPRAAPLLPVVRAPRAPRGRVPAGAVSARMARSQGNLRNDCALITQKTGCPGASSSARTASRVSFATSASPASTWTSTPSSVAS